MLMKSTDFFFSVTTPHRQPPGKTGIFCRQVSGRYYHRELESVNQQCGGKGTFSL